MKMSFRMPYGEFSSSDSSWSNVPSAKSEEAVEEETEFPLMQVPSGFMSPPPKPMLVVPHPSRIEANIEKDLKKTNSRGFTLSTLKWLTIPFAKPPGNTTTNEVTAYLAKTQPPTAKSKIEGAGRGQGRGGGRGQGKDIGPTSPPPPKNKTTTAPSTSVKTGNKSQNNKDRGKETSEDENTKSPKRDSGNSRNSNENNKSSKQGSGNSNGTNTKKSPLKDSEKRRSNVSDAESNTGDETEDCEFQIQTDYCEPQFETEDCESPTENEAAGSKKRETKASQTSSAGRNKVSSFSQASDKISGTPPDSNDPKSQDKVQSQQKCPCNGLCSCCMNNAKTVEAKLIQYSMYQPSSGACCRPQMNCRPRMDCNSGNRSKRPGCCLPCQPMRPCSCRRCCMYHYCVNSYRCNETYYHRGFPNAYMPGGYRLGQTDPCCPAGNNGYGCCPGSINCIRWESEYQGKYRDFSELMGATCPHGEIPHDKVAEKEGEECEESPVEKKDSGETERKSEDKSGRRDSDRSSSAKKEPFLPPSPIDASPSRKSDNSSPVTRDKKSDNRKLNNSNKNKKN